MLQLVKSRKRFSYFNYVVIKHVPVVHISKVTCTCTSFLVSGIKEFDSATLHEKKMFEKSAP